MSHSPPSYACCVVRTVVYSVELIMIPSHTLQSCVTFATILCLLCCQDCCVLSGTNYDSKSHSTLLCHIRYHPMPVVYSVELIMIPSHTLHSCVTFATILCMLCCQDCCVLSGTNYDSKSHSTILCHIRHHPMSVVLSGLLCTQWN